MAVARNHANPQYIRSGEAAKLLGVSDWTIREMARRGQLAALKTSTARQEFRFRRADIERVRREWEAAAREQVEGAP